MQNTNDSVLVDAINNRDLALLKAALASGANIEAPDLLGYAGIPLRTACFLGYSEIVSELLKSGANPDAANADGPGAPLRMAKRCGHTVICSQLEQHYLLKKAVDRIDIDHPELGHPIEVENLEIEACCGADTEVLLEDLVHIMRTESEPQELRATPPVHPGKFWRHLNK